MVFWTAAALAAVAVSSLATVGIESANAAGAFEKDINTKLTKSEREERAKRAQAAQAGGKSSTVLTGGTLTQGGSNTALGGGG